MPEKVFESAVFTKKSGLLTKRQHQ